MYTAALLLTMGVVTLIAGLPQQDPKLVQKRGFECPDLDTGVYEDPYQCDKYWECDQGIATEKLCDDGLVFDIFKGIAGSADPCESPYVVDCGDRLELQEPIGSGQCPRRNGIFADQDPTICNRFYTCIKGKGTATDCSAGLHFDETNGNCAWPISAGRTGCTTNPRACMGDFCCNPEQERLTVDGVKAPHPRYPNPVNCQKFYVCLNGFTPQESSCDLGQVYDDTTMLCDYPENVPECAGWYADNPLFDVAYDTGSDGIIDTGVRKNKKRPSIN